LLSIRNKTPLEVALFPWIDAEGGEAAVLLIKGTFSLRNARGQLPLSQEQLPVTRSDEYRGDPAASSILYASESCPTKPGTDIVLLGHAYAPNGTVKTLDLTLKVGGLQKGVRVFGERKWVRAVGAWQISHPVPFQSMPLVYERAFGGVDAKNGAQDPRNPVGTGFAARNSAERLEGLALPNLEYPEALIRAWDSRPEPAGFGFVAPSWVPRSHYAGTYYEAWKKDRFPLTPQDFDERFFNAAPRGLVARPHLKGGEPVHINGASKRGPLSFSLPRWTLQATLSVRGKRSQHTPLLETVIIEPDEERIILSWKATMPCARSFLYIDEAVVTGRMQES
jgi:hypothetical protein